MIRVIIIAFLFLSNFLLLAQNNQQGMVKMKGRLNQSGTIITGTGVPNALVSIKGYNPFKTTSKGLFSFPVKGNYFYILSVKKDGLQLLDPDIISRSNSYTPNSIIYITLEEPSSRIEDKLAAERKIRKKLRKQLEEKEDSIENLKRINRISTQQYNELLTSLYREEEENEKLITSMAERYASIDFDLLDDFNKKISECILNGDLTKADSLLQTKGSMDKRIAHINKLKKANIKEREYLDNRENNLQKSELLLKNEIEDVARDCYSHFEIFRLQHRLDSAEYYLEQRANLDMLNFDYVWECASYFLNEGNYKKARPYYEILCQNHTLNNDFYALALNDLALCYTYMGESALGIETMKKSYDIRMDLLKENPVKYKCSAALANSNFAGVAFMVESSLDVEEFYKKAIDLYSELAKELPLFDVCMANSEENYGYYLFCRNRIDESYAHTKNALEIRQSYAAKFPSVYYTTDNVTQSDILNIIQNESFNSPNIDISKECLLILAAAARDNKSHIASSAHQLTFSMFEKMNVEDAENMITLASKVQKELYEEKPFKEAYNTINTLLNKFDLLSQKPDQIESLIEDAEYVLDIVNADKPYYQDDDFDYFTIHKCSILLGIAYKKSNLEKSCDYLSRALKNIEHCVSNSKINYNNDYLFILRQLAENYYISKDYDKSIQYLNDALSFDVLNNENQFMVPIRSELVTVYLSMSDFDHAKNNIHPIIDYLENMSDIPVPNLAMMYYLLGGCEKQTGEIEFSKEHLSHALDLLKDFEEIDDCKELIKQIKLILNQI